MGISTVQLTTNNIDLAKARSMLIGIENGFPRAMSRALNRSASGVQTDMVDLARDRYNFKAAAVKARTEVKRATYTRLFASVTSIGDGVHLTDILGTRKTKKGLSVDVDKSTGRQLIKHAFINNAQKSGKLIAYRREFEGGKRVARYDIEALYAPHPEVVYNTPKNWALLQVKARTRLDSNLSGEIDAVLRGF